MEYTQMYLLLWRNEIKATVYLCTYCHDAPQTVKS